MTRQKRLQIKEIRQDRDFLPLYFSPRKGQIWREFTATGRRPDSAKLPLLSL